MFEAQPCRAIAAHAEAFDDAAFTLRQRAEAAVDMRDEFLDEHRLQLHRAIFPITPHAHRQSIREDHDHRRDFARPHGLAITLRHLRGRAGRAAAAAVKPVEHGKALFFGCIVVLRREDIAAHRFTGGFAVEKHALQARCRGLGQHPDMLLLGTKPGDGEKQTEKKSFHASG